MTHGERLEILAIAFAAMSPIAFFGDRVFEPRLGALIAYSAALLLGQGLVRDVARLAWRRLRGGGAGEGRRILCLCAESTIGLLLAGIGLALTLGGIRDTVALSGTGLTILVAAVLAAGFVAKDYVISIRKEKDHASVIVW